MPIRPDLLHYYSGPEWQAIRARILGRANDQCEQCGKPNHAHVNTFEGGFWFDEAANCWRDNKGMEWAGKLRTFRKVRIVICIAHLNHDPADNRDVNLKALCQHCHLKHDMRKHHARARRTVAAKSGQMWLTEELEKAS